jgi:hypothetical protein
MELWSTNTDHSTSCKQNSRKPVERKHKKNEATEMEGDGAEDADGGWSCRCNQMIFFQINCKICSVEATKKDKR